MTDTKITTFPDTASGGRLAEVECVEAVYLGQAPDHGAPGAEAATGSTAR